MTKTLAFKNKELAAIGNFLGTLSLKNKASRGRTKLIKLISAKNDEYNEERKDALEPYIKKDEAGKDVEGSTPGSVVLIEEKQDEATSAIKEIDEESAVIEFTEYNEKMKALYDAIVDYPTEFSNQDAAAYDLLMDQLESAFENETEETK
ncbi:hypothetical protein LTWDN19_00160 [Latilactobacillus curvatus]|uniref:DUF1617 family protein n=1 Tax=Latilactobacillus curvatus TaxID=28038 RepID=A0ABM7QQU3_LATCU|nr:DUF1617 family protein [Latilactobacillus curvatus]BCX29449.1 hypothetical protein LTWDN19_00160 [Latilactobacillus curvatus]